MKKFIKTMCVITILAGLTFATANSRVKKSDIKMKRTEARTEPDHGNSNLLRGDRSHCPPVYPVGLDGELIIIPLVL